MRSVYRSGKWVFGRQNWPVDAECFMSILLCPTVRKYTAIGGIVQVKNRHISRIPRIFAKGKEMAAYADAERESVWFGVRPLAGCGAGDFGLWGWKNGTRFGGMRKMVE